MLTRKHLLLIYLFYATLSTHKIWQSTCCLTVLLISTSFASKKETVWASLLLTTTCTILRFLQLTTTQWGIFLQHTVHNSLKCRASGKDMFALADFVWFRFSFDFSFCLVWFGSPARPCSWRSPCPPPPQSSQCGPPWSQLLRSPCFRILSFAVPGWSSFYFFSEYFSSRMFGFLQLVFHICLV